MPPSTAGIRRKRANSADDANSSKRTRTDHENTTATADLKNGRVGRKGRGKGKRENSAEASDARKKPKANGESGSHGLEKSTSKGEAEPTRPSEARPELGDKKIVQAVPAAADSAGNARKGGQDKVSSWAAFRFVVQKLKEAGHKSVKIEIDPRTPLAKFFPLLPGTVFRNIPFRNCALEYRFEPEGDKPAGASLIAEIELKGALKELWQVFSTVLGQQEPILRVAAFLGATLDENIAIDSLTLVGCFIGCNIQYPADSKLVRITSLGATISISTKAEAVLLDVAKAAILPSAVAEEVSSSLSLQEKLVSETAEALGTPLRKPQPGVQESMDDATEIEAQAPRNGLVNIEDQEAAELEGNGEVLDDQEEEEQDDEDEEEEEEEEGEEEAEDEGEEEDVSRHINYSVFGTVELPVPGQPLSLALDLDLSVVTGMILFSMSPKGADKAWDNVFGFENIDLKNVLFKVGYPLKAKKEEDEDDGADDDKLGVRKDEDSSEDKQRKTENDLQQKNAAAESDKESLGNQEKVFSDLMGNFAMKKGQQEKDDQAFVAFQAGWESGVGEITIFGKITQDFVSSTLKGTVKNVTFAKIKHLFESTHNISLGDTDIDIEAKTLSVEISKEGLRLEGDLNIYGKAVSAVVLLSTEGVSLTAKTPKWEVDDDKVLIIENAEVSFFVGCVGKKADTTIAEKALKKSVGWFGGFSVKGTFTYKQALEITVSLQIVRKTGGGWGYIVMGQAESDLSLADLMDGCPKDGDLDFSLKKIWLVASNIDVDPTMLPPDAQKFPVKKGIYLCTYLETVPLIDGGSNLVKKADPNDVAYLYLGLQSGGLPSVAINLPKTMSIELGSRAKVGGFACHISIGTSGPEIKFTGHVMITMEADRTFDFELMLAGDVIGGQLSIVMDGIIENPFGLSNRIALGATGDGQKLGIQAGIIWAQLATTGLPAALGLSGTLALDHGTSKAKTYGMTVNLSENPMDFIIIINATSLSYADLVDIASALTSTQIPAGEVPGASFKNVEVYASLGGSFGSQTYPPGFRMRGIMTINNEEAYFMCDISTSGLKMLACIPSFEVGPLRLTGEKDPPTMTDWPVVMEQLAAEKLAKNHPDTAALVAFQSYQGKYAMLDLQITMAKQYFLLNGKIEIFGLIAYADIECQFKPEPKFKFDFTLRWNNMLKLEIHAKMLDSKHLDRPREADFEIYAVLEQTIVKQIVETLTGVLKTTSETLSKGVGKAKAEAEELERKKRQLCESAIRYLKECEDDFAKEKKVIEQKIAANKQQTIDRARQLQEKKAEIEARNQQRKREADETREREKREKQEQKNRRKAEEDARVAQLAREQEQKRADKAQQERNMKSEFGDITLDGILRAKRNIMNGARENRDYWDRRVDEINGFYHPADEADARGSYVTAVVLFEAAEAGFYLLERMANSDRFRDARNWLNHLDNELDNLGQRLDQRWREAQETIRDLGSELDESFRDIDRACDNMISEVQADLETVSADLDNFVAEQQAALNKLGLELEGMVNGAKAKAVRSARDKAETAKNDDTLLVAARKTLDSFDKLQRGAFDKLEEMIQGAVGDMVDVQHVSVSGKIMAEQKSQAPFVVTIKGVFCGKKDFEFELEWMPWRPGEDDMALFKRLAGMVMAFLNGEGVGRSKLIA